MKRLISLLLSLLLTFSLAACGSDSPAEQPSIENEPVWEPFGYELLLTTGFSQETMSEDGVLVCSAHYEIPKLLPYDELTAAQQTSVDAFQAAMEEILSGSCLFHDSLSETALEDYTYRLSTDLEWYGHYTDEMSYMAYHTPYAVSLNFEAYTYSGGAYPNSGNVCYLFDLEAGKMVSVDDIADGDAFRSIIAEAILAEIQRENLAELYYDDYETTVREQSEVQYFFTEHSVVVYFGDYTLAPHAAGYPTFEIQSEQYRDCLSERGLRLLGFIA